MKTRIAVKPKPLQALAHSPPPPAWLSLSRRQIIATIPIILGLEAPIDAVSASGDVSRSIEKDYDGCGGGGT